MDMTELNGQPALVVRDGDEMLGTMAIETDGEKITTLYGLRNPDKLQRLMDLLKLSAPGSSAPAAR
jgi:RNA polymerase sigma-70 factor (ECF subfamily)